MKKLKVSFIIEKDFDYKHLENNLIRLFKEKFGINKEEIIDFITEENDEKGEFISDLR